MSDESLRDEVHRLALELEQIGRDLERHDQQDRDARAAILARVARVEWRLGAVIVAAATGQSLISWLGGL